MFNAPKIYSCAEWGAVAPTHDFERTNPTAIVIHHMDYPNRALAKTPEEAKTLAFELARACQRDHMQVNGWADTGQSFTVSRDGVILEGRHGTLAAALQGHSVHAAHAADGAIDFNQDFGIENEGTYDFISMPAPQWQSLVKLCAWLADICKIDSSRIIGHRDTGIATDCPGAWLESRLPALRRAAHNLKQGTLKP